MDNVKRRLFELQDLEYKKFHARLMPTIDDGNIIGIRVPKLRRFAKEFSEDEAVILFLNELPHYYYEENNLHAFLIEQISDFDTVLRETNKFLPYIDNWATCDMFSPKVFSKNKELLLAEIKTWVKSKHSFTVRYAIGMLMRYFLDDVTLADMVAGVQFDDYYVNMMKAWYFATALSYDFEAFLPFIIEKKLDKWVHNKTIQKAVESKRISSEEKEFLKKYRIGRG